MLGTVTWSFGGVSQLATADALAHRRRSEPSHQRSLGERLQSTACLAAQHVLIWGLQRQSHCSSAWVASLGGGQWPASSPSVACGPREEPERVRGGAPGCLSGTRLALHHLLDHART